MAASGAKGSSTPKRQPTWRLVWFLFFTVASLGIALAVIVSCCSPTTSDIHILTFNPSEFVIQLEEYYYGPDWPEIIDYPTLVMDFGLYDLPDEYRFGISGLCRTYAFSPTVCESHFPQMIDLYGAISQDLTNLTQLYWWDRALIGNNIGNADNLNPSMVNAAAALLLVSILVAAAVIVTTVVGRQHVFPKWSIALDLFDAMLMATSGALFTAMTVEIVSRSTVYNTTSVVDATNAIHFGPAFWMLWAVCLGKLLVTPFMAFVVLVVIPLVVGAATARGNGAGAGDATSACVVGSNDNDKLLLW